jgi:hypothetical protein
MIVKKLKFIFVLICLVFTFENINAQIIQDVFQATINNPCEDALYKQLRTEIAVILVNRGAKEEGMVWAKIWEYHHSIILNGVYYENPLPYSFAGISYSTKWQRLCVEKCGRLKAGGVGKQNVNYPKQRAEYWKNYFEKQEQRRQAEIERKQQLVEPYRQNIGQTTGSVISGINNISQANTHFKNSDHLGGDIANANSIDNAKQDDDFLNYNIPQEEEAVKIGIYQNEPVLKVGDTIITTFDNNIYLLSQQPISGNGYDSDLNVTLAQGAFIIQRPINEIGDWTKNTPPIGYVILHSGKTTEKGIPISEWQFFPKKENNRIKIGDYKIAGRTLPVYLENNVILVSVPLGYGIEEEKYLLSFQPLQKSFDNTLTRYFIIYEGENVRFNGKKLTGENKRNLIGWINYDNNNDYRFIQYDNNPAKIPGLNYFGSVYIGDNNPENANETSNFDIPAQDEIDRAAKEHDICYGNNDLKGAAGVFLTSKGLHCENDIVAACLNELNIKDISEFVANSSMNTSYYVKIVAGIIGYNAADISFLKKFADIVNTYSLGKISEEAFKIRPKRDRAILVMGLFLAASTEKAIIANAPAIIDFTASATKTGLGFATTATTGFFATTGAMTLAVPVLSVAAVNLLQTEAKCIYSFLTDNVPAHCYSTTGIITHAWDVKASKEMIAGAFSAGVGKGYTKSMKKILNVNTTIKTGKTSYDVGQVTLQTTYTTLSSLSSIQEENNK